MKALARKGAIAMAVAAIIGLPASTAMAHTHEHYHGTICCEDYLLHDGSYYDVYEVYLHTGEHLHVDMASFEIDSYLIVEDPHGNWIAQDDDSGGGLNASLQLVAPCCGYYRVMANTYGANDFGCYDLAIESH